MEPKLRLKEFTGNWQETPLKSFFTKVTNKNTRMLYSAVLTNSAEHGIIDQRDYFDFDVANSDNINGYYIVEPDDFVYNPRVSVTAPVGPINRNKLGYIGVMSPLYLVFKIDGINKDFLCHYYKTKKWHKFMRLSGNCGARFDRLSISDDQFVQMPIVHPINPKEQQAICDFIDNIDSYIASSDSRLASLKQIKAASLQAMFPKVGETIPKIRFKGYEGNWKKVKLSSFSKRVTRKNTHLESTLALTIASAHGLVSQIDYFNNLVVGSNISNYYLLKKGEFAYNKSYSNGYPFGSVKRLDRYDQGILSTLYITFSIDDSISSDYLTHFFDTTLWHKEVADRAAEGARNHGLLNIGADAFLDIYIWMPESVEEQQKIADYFTSIDKQIALLSQHLEKLKQIKNTCLEKLFV